MGKAGEAKRGGESVQGRLAPEQFVTERRAASVFLALAKAEAIVHEPQPSMETLL